LGWIGPATGWDPGF